MISAQKAKQLDTTTMFTYSDANTPLSQSERAYYLSYFINDCITLQLSLLASYIFTDCTLIIKYISIVVILTGFDSEKYSLLGCNLKNRAALENCLLKCGLNTTVPTLLLSEVVLTYIDPPQRYVLFKH